MDGGRITVYHEIERNGTIKGVVNIGIILELKFSPIIPFKINS